MKSFYLCTFYFMDIIHNIGELQRKLHSQKENGLSIGFVPTMGALHQGHISLVEKASRENDIVVVSIFVNPTQFNNPDDLQNYPRTLDADTTLLRKHKCNFVFAPDEKTIYPEPDTRIFSFGRLEEVMEGMHRPGHFTGVARVVSKLFSIVKPHKAYFGEKDFQQLAIIQNMVDQMKFDTSIVPCPIIREEDGLAMSSRNALLTPAQRNVASSIYQAMKKVEKKYNTNTINELKSYFKEAVELSPLLKVEYVEIADELTLEPIDQKLDKQHVRLFVAVHAGDVRLIDNLKINS